MRERAEQHGGRLRFFSKPGLGVTVALRLPRSLPKHLDISANL
jgi:signal transduction histidine kinase